jgi:isoleucyl-tRNA synthetase
MKAEIFANKDANYMDRYIIAASQSLIKSVRKEMDIYHLYAVVRHTLEFLENLTNWYVRLNRGRMKGESDTAADPLLEQRIALNTLFDVLLSATQIMAPITPFLSEFLFQNMRNGIAEDSELY